MTDSHFPIRNSENLKGVGEMTDSENGFLPSSERNCLSLEMSSGNDWSLSDEQKVAGPSRGWRPSVSNTETSRTSEQSADRTAVAEVTLKVKFQLKLFSLLMLLLLLDRLRRLQWNWLRQNVEILLSPETNEGKH